MKNSRSDDPHKEIVQAVIVEEPALLRGLIEEHGSNVCDRCGDAGQLIAGMVFFQTDTRAAERRIGKIAWALCAPCLETLKHEQGSEEA